MDNQLVRYASGAAVVPKQDRQVAKRAQAIYDETRIAGMKADANMALAGHIMDGMVTLYERRRALAEDDPAVDMMLGEIQKNTMRALRRIQTNLFNEW